MTMHRVGDIRPNPFRDIDNYPIIEAKVAALRESFRNTTVWPVILGRRGADGVEIAFGHHRLEAARREFGPDGEFPVTILPLSDAEMLKMMANENMTEYAASAQVEQNTVAAVLRAYAEGRIELEAPSSKVSPEDIKYVGGGPLTYTTGTIARFLGWVTPSGGPRDSVKFGVAALEAIEQGEVEREDFHGLSQKQARAVMQTVSGARRQAESRGVDPKPVVQAARRAAVTAAKADKGYEVIREVGHEAIVQALPKREAPPVVPAKRAQAIHQDITRFFGVGLDVNGQTLSREQVIRLVAENRDAVELQGIAKPYADQIAEALDDMAADATRLAAALRHQPVMLRAAK